MATATTAGKATAPASPNDARRCGDFEHDASVIRSPELVFKQGIGYDSAKLRASVAGAVGLR